MPHAAFFILTFFSIFFTRISGAQRLAFSTYSMNEGLAQNAVRDIFQDSKGFIWIGTWEGLSKYDGNKFINYTTSNGLSHGLINQILETDNNDILIVCNDGSIDIIQNNSELKPFHKSSTVVNRLQKMPDGKIISLTDHQGIYEFNNRKLIKPAQSRPIDTYYKIVPFNDSLLVVLSDSSLQLITNKYEAFSQLKEQFAGFAESDLLVDSKKRVWVGTTSGLKLLAPIQKKGQPLQFLPLPETFNVPLLKSAWIRDILEDAEGTIWIGTLKGLVKIGADGSHQLITEREGLPTNDVLCLFQDMEKNIWVGGSRGVAKLVTKTKINTYTTANGMLDDNIIQLLPSNNGNFLVITQQGTQLFDKSKNTFLPASAGRDHSGGSGAYFAVKDSAGNFFTPSHGGVMFTDDFINWQKVLFYPKSAALLIDSKKNMWVGGLDSGLFRIQYNYIDDTPRLVRQTQYLSGSGIRSIYQDSKGYIWAGTRYHGIFRIHPENPGDTVLHFNQAKGLTSNRITSIAEDKNGSIWLSFYHGLDKLIPADKSYRVFNFSRFTNLFTNIQAMIIDNDCSLWLATSQGLLGITDGELENNGPLKVYITAASLGDSVYRNYSKKKINLSYRHKQVQFEFSAPGFINAKQVLFSYRLLGSNNTDWSLPANDHIVSYASLQPGSYRFEVRTKGWNDEWGEAAVFEFSISPPFWQTWWFRLVALLIIAGLITWLVRRRIKAIRHAAAMKQKISETEMMALRAQMNPHFIFNCLNAIDNLVQTNQKEKATTYLARFAKLIRSVLESSKNNVVPFQKDFESLQLYLQMEQFRCNDKFSYELTADEELLHSDYKIPPLIIQPFVENAIHHGLLNKETGDRKLTVNASLENDVIKYVITDNGVGRTRAKEIKELNKPGQQSYGIAITEERIHLNNQHKKPGDIVITDLWDNEHPAGTKIEVCLKIYEDK